MPCHGRAGSSPAMNTIQKKREGFTVSELFTRPSGEKVSIEEVAKIAAEYILRAPDAEYEVTVGTDSQNFHKTKMVEVIAVRKMGRGGIFFYRVNYITRISNLRQKIQEETQRSLILADEFLEYLEYALLEAEQDLEQMDVHFKIHCDIGKYGSTQALIQEIVGWVKSMGYDCEIKPSSYTASAVANKFSK